VTLGGCLKDDFKITPEGKKEKVTSGYRGKTFKTELIQTIERGERKELPFMFFYEMFASYDMIVSENFEVEVKCLFSLVLLISLQKSLIQ